MADPEPVMVALPETVVASITTFQDFQDAVFVLHTEAGLDQHISVEVPEDLKWLFPTAKEQYPVWDHWVRDEGAFLEKGEYESSFDAVWTFALAGIGRAAANPSRIHDSQGDTDKGTETRQGVRFGRRTVLLTAGALSIVGTGLFGKRAQAQVGCICTTAYFQCRCVERYWPPAFSNVGFFLQDRAILYFDGGSCGSICRYESRPCNGSVGQPCCTGCWCC